MSKLFNLKEWLTVADAARHLAIIFGEEITEADVLRLALEGHLKLSIHFVNHARGKCGKVIGWEETEWGTFEKSNIPQPKNVSAPPEKVMECPPNLLALYDEIPEIEKGGFVPYLKSLNIDGKRFINLDDEVTIIRGVWDLPMVGAEKLDIEHAYQKLTDGPAITLSNLAGPFVEGADGQMCQLQDSFEPREIETPHGKKTFDRSYYPADGLPDDSVLVVRTDALRKFEQSINDTQANKEKPLITTERNTLLSIIAALCDYSDIKHQERGAAGQIANLPKILARR